MATVRELVTKYGFEVNDKPLKDLNETLKESAMSVAGVAASFAVAAGAIFGVVAATAHAGDEAKATAQKLGITTEALGRLQYAAKLSNLSAEGLQTGLRFLSKNAVEASKGGGDAADAFKKVGVSLKDNDGKFKTADKLTLELADKFKKMPDGIERSALAMKIFGRGGSEMIPFLLEGSQSLKEMGDEAEQFGLIFTKDQSDMADQVNDNFDRITSAFTGLTYTIGKELLPVFKDLTEGFIEFLKANRVDILNGIRVAFSGLSKYLEIGWKMFKQLVTSAKGFVQLFGGFENVVKIFSVLASIFASGTILYAIGAISVAAYGMAAAFTVANIAALAIPIAIGLAIVALGLIIEDIVTFFQGGESYFGDFINYFKEEFPAAFAFLQKAFSIAGDAVGVYIDIWKSLFSTFVSVIGFVMSNVIPAFKLLFSVIGAIGSGIGTVIGGIGSVLSAGAEILGGNMGPSSQVTNANQSSNVNNINAPITVTAGGNLSSGQAASSVRSGVGDGLDSILRGANRSYQGGVAY